jgi:predicted ATPase/class 3 adenylate cyclase
MAITASLRFSDLLRRYRQTAGLTQAELAERAGLSVRGINDLERGVRQSPRKDTVVLLAEALDLSDEERAAFAAAARRGMGRAAPAPSGASPPSTVQNVSTAPALPSGTVTFLFTDIEGSTRLLQQLGAPSYATVRAEHERLLHAAIAAHSGRVVDAADEGWFLVFACAPDALAAAVEVQRALATYLWPAGTMLRVRMGLHTGTAQVVGERYVGLDMHRAARIAAAGHGGQVLLSAATRELVEDALPAGALLRDLGAHQLKDLQRPEHLFQLVLPDRAGLPDLPTDFPPLRTLDHYHHNLPVQPTPLLGREQEMTAVCALLRREDARLVTLTGPGGVGKTRLGLQVAAELVDAFADGVWFVSLSRLADPELVVPTIARTLGLQEVGSRSIEELLREHLRARQVLLLLDNCEQVAAAAPVVADLLQTSPQLTVLATSRVVLHLQSEQEFPVPPLALPSTSPTPRRLTAEQVLEAPAVALFVERARAHRPDFALTESTATAVASICARLDGLPLALGLAAARVKVLPPAQLLARLERRLPLLTDGPRDVEVRQQTMHNTLAWSEDLLRPEERRLFRRLAVFVGGFTLEAAEAVCAAPEGAEPLGLDVLEGLGRLVDQSLLHQQTVGDAGEGGEGSGEARFRLLYVVREYALEQLETSAGGGGDHAGQVRQEAEALRRAHAVYYLGLVEERAFAVFRQEGAAWMRRLEREHDNLRAALTWAQERREVELGLRLVGSLGPFWYVRGYFTEGRGWVDRLLALAPQAAGDRAGAGAGDKAVREGEGTPGVAGVSAAAHAGALVAASIFALQQGDIERAQTAAEEALALAQARGQQAGWAAGAALVQLGFVAYERGHLEQAMAYLEEGVAHLRAVGEPWLAAICLTIVGLIALDRGDLEQATACCEESLAFARRTGADFVAGNALFGLVALAWRRGDLASAEVLGNEQVLAGWRLGVPNYLADGLESLALTAAAAAAAGEGAWAERAAHLLGAAAALRATVGAPWGPWRRVQMERTVAPAQAAAQAALGEGAWTAAFAAGRAMTIEEAVTEALGEAD